MKLYAILNRDGTEVLSVTAEKDELDTAGIRKCLDGFAVMRPVVDMPKPKINYGENILVGPRYVIRAGSVERHYDPRPLTAQEAETFRRSRMARIPRPVLILLRNLFDRVSVLEGGQRLSDQDFEATLTDAISRE